MPFESSDDARSIAGKEVVIERMRISEQLDRIISSPEFRATDRQKEFLRFVVEKSIEGRSDIIKGYTIATQILGRKENFNQTTDPIVSVEAGRLRRALERYYLASGSQDPVRIDIPKGSFVPTFQFLSRDGSALDGPGKRTSLYHYDEEWPTVVVQPFMNLTKDEGPEYFAEGFVSELAAELSRYREFRVLLKPQGKESANQILNARFSLEGNIRCGGGELVLTTHLVDETTRQQLWADIYQCPLKDTDIFSLQREMAQRISAIVAEQEGIIAQTLSREAESKSSNEMKTFEAFLKFYKHDANYSLETFLEALPALEAVVVKEPENAKAWTYLGALYTENYGLELTDRETPIEQAIDFIENSVRLDPHSQIAHAWLAEACLLGDRLSEGLYQANAALALNPNSLIFLDFIGQVMALLGEWEKGAELTQIAIKINPFHRPYVHNVMCLRWLRQKEYKKALEETRLFRLPDLFWDHLLVAVTSGQLNKIEDGNKAVQRLLNIKPGFAKDGRRLIRKYIKSDNLLEIIIAGLEKVGLKLT
jgi:TolB-like protein